MYMHVLRIMAGWTLTDVHACIKDMAGWTLTDVHACIKDHGRMDPY